MLFIQKLSCVDLEESIYYYKYIYKNSIIKKEKKISLVKTEIKKKNIAENFFKK